MRLDQYVAQFWPEQSRSTWQKLIKAGHVKVNGEVVTLTKYELEEDDQVAVTPPVEHDFSKKTLPVVYEDENVIVINKPVGVLTHAKGALSEEFTVADFFKDKTTYHKDTNRPGIIHRLDRDTSGILIGAKNDETAKLLVKQFQDRKAKKTYEAILSAVPKEPVANIDLPIERNPSKPSTFRVGANGKNATTAYEVEVVKGNKALVRLTPTTGRTHQLRVHMAYINAPILGDKVYGKPASRLFLHASSLEITIPKGNRMIFTAPLPNEFQEEMAK